MDFDTQWKVECVRLALIEQIEFTGEIDWNKIFQKAKIIYDKGYEHTIQSWESIWTVKDEKPALKQGEVFVATKQCLQCKETIPSGWNKHSYKRSGERCGYAFSDKKEGA